MTLQPRSGPSKILAQSAALSKLSEMTDGVGTDLDLVRKRVAALYRCDYRGRLISVNQWDGGLAPRFFMMRTQGNVVCRFRADLPDDLVDHLQQLSAQEPTPPGMLPALHSQYLDALAAHARVDRVWAGPIYMCPQDLAPTGSIVPINEDNAEFLRGGFEHWLADIPHRQPFVALVENHRAVSICASVRISPAVHCAGVETQVGYRQKGYAVSAVAAWATVVRAQGAIPFYSTSWENHASQRVAARLGLSLVGVDFHVT
jgi:RimJ/RimL family protein N-acetyltransferase